MQGKAFLILNKSCLNSVLFHFQIKETVLIGEKSFLCKEQFSISSSVYSLYEQPVGFILCFFLFFPFHFVYVCMRTSWLLFFSVWLSGVRVVSIIILSRIRWDTNLYYIFAVELLYRLTAISVSLMTEAFLLILHWD